MDPTALNARDTRRDLQIRDYDTPVTILRKVRQDDGHGGFLEEWRQHAKTWANVRPLSAASRYFAGQVLGTATHALALRDRRLDVQTSDRVQVHDQAAPQAATAAGATPGWGIAGVLRESDGRLTLQACEGT